MSHVDDGGRPVAWPQRFAPPAYDCPFCRLGRGEFDGSLRNNPADVVERRDGLVAVVATHTWPANAGNLVVLPEHHYETVFDLPDTLAVPLLRAVRRLGRALVEAFGCPGVSTRQHNGPAGNQTVFHHHVHVVPRWPGDEFYPRFHDWQRTRDEVRAEQAAALRSVLEASPQAPSQLR